MNWNNFRPSLPTSSLQCHRRTLTFAVECQYYEFSSLILLSLWRWKWNFLSLFVRLKSAKKRHRNNQWSQRRRTREEKFIKSQLKENSKNFLSLSLSFNFHFLFVVYSVSFRTFHSVRLLFSWKCTRNSN